jgi:SAM-dependent methyltransferase
MPFQTPRSLKHEYELYVEREIEDYKDSVPRSALLKIGDEAVAVLNQAAQGTLTEIIVWHEVDQIIMKRLRIPSYPTWRRRRLRELAQYRTPEHWGIDPDAALVREMRTALDRHVLVAGTAGEGHALYLAANGCAVTAIDPAADVMQRVLNAAEQAGLTDRVRGYCADLTRWYPDVELHAVVCGAAALAGLSPDARAHVLTMLQQATAQGGVHLVETLSHNATAPHTTARDTGIIPIEELQDRYRGWNVTLERTQRNGVRTFLARKEAVA